ncbi:ABC transporter ATP-binding protein [Oscillospiraceae bacterium 50-16]
MGERLLTVENLKSHFFLASGTVKAVDGVSFTLDKGEVLGIVGESGCGKSVTASSIIRLLPPKVGRIVDGSIRFEDRDVLSFSQKQLRDFRGRDISTIFQNPMTSLDPVFKIGNQMVEMIRAHHKEIDRNRALEISIDALRRVGIPNPEKRVSCYPYELSGGMCQRVIIAMALCCAPKLIIADEPTTALDVTVQSQVLKLLKQLRDEQGVAILLITHNLGIVWEMCDRVMTMYAGKTVEYTATAELYSHPLHPYTWGLLDSIPSLNDQKGRLNTIEGMPPDLRLTGTCCNFYNRCPYATPLCKQQVPELVEVEQGHFVACHRQNGNESLKRGEYSGTGQHHSENPGA